MREYMKLAYEEAKKAYYEGEVPVGCVIIRDDDVIAKAHNMTIALNDKTAHAEMLAVREAKEHLKSSVFNGCELYVTMEPCPMCAYAILNMGIRKIVFGVSDEKFGSLGSYINLASKFKNVEVYGGIYEEKCEKILKDFFKKIRKGEIK